MIYCLSVVVATSCVCTRKNLDVNLSHAEITDWLVFTRQITAGGGGVSLWFSPVSRWHQSGWQEEVMSVQTPTVPRVVLHPSSGAVIHSAFLGLDSGAQADPGGAEQWIQKCSNVYGSKFTAWITAVPTTGSIMFLGVWSDMWKWGVNIKMVYCRLFSSFDVTDSWWILCLP